MGRLPFLFREIPMITLKTLLDQLQDICRCMVRNDYDTTRFISRIDILRQNTVLCPDTLYLCPDDIPENLLKPDAFSAPAPEQSPVLLIDARKHACTGRYFSVVEPAADL